jgi:hypothetical protein
MNKKGGNMVKANKLDLSVFPQGWFDRYTPKGAKLWEVEIEETGTIVGYGDPEEGHNCDAMGCPTTRHVIFISFRPRDIYSLIAKDRLPKDFPFPEDMPFPPWIIRDRGTLRAKCPKCGRITSVRVCYGCQELMCEDCLKEHQIICLHKGEGHD